MWRAKDFGERWHYLAIKSLGGSKTVWEPVGVYCAVQNKNLTLLFGFSDRWALGEGGGHFRELAIYQGGKRQMNARNATC